MTDQLSRSSEQDVCFMVARVSAVFVAVLALYVGPAFAWSEQSCASAHRTPITLNASVAGHVGEVRVDLVSTDFEAAYMFSPEGDDVRLFESDNVTPVDFIITAWDGVTRSATLYLRRASLAAAESVTLNMYYGDTALAPISSAPEVFPDTGMRLRSRVSTTDPMDAAGALAAFSSATMDVYDDVRSSISGLNNRALGGTNGDYGWCVSAMVEVTPATAGLWEFRYGGDFGRGGHLYVKGVSLEEQWNDDLWWAGNFANTGETLEGAITLSEGWHRYEALGFEGCCDGPVGWQARAPGGAWLDFTSSNFTLRAAQCITPDVTVTPTAPASCSTVLNASKSVSVISDVMGNADPYALPGSIVRYQIDVENPGQSAATLNIADALPPGIALVVDGVNAFELIDGAVPSGLGFTFGGATDATDSVAFSIDGMDFSYTPVPGGPNNIDPAVTHVRFLPAGVFSPHSAGNSPAFSIRFSAVVE